MRFFFSKPELCLLDLQTEYVHAWLNDVVADALAMARANATKATRAQTAASMLKRMTADVTHTARVARSRATCLWIVAATAGGSKPCATERIIFITHHKLMYHHRSHYIYTSLGRENTYAHAPIRHNIS
jgi:hypothetical protein